MFCLHEKKYCFSEQVHEFDHVNFNHPLYQVINHNQNVVQHLVNEPITTESVVQELKGSDDDKYYNIIRLHCDAVYNIKLYYDGEPSPFYYSNGCDITNLFTKSHPYILCLTDGLIIQTKKKPTSFSISLVFFATELRNEFIHSACSIYTITGYYFVSYWYRFYPSIHPVSKFRDLHYTARKIQRWWKENILKKDARKKFLDCKKELIYSLPYGVFRGGIMYQEGLERFTSFQNSSYFLN
jgi:hypothetical protein